MPTEITRASVFVHAVQTRQLDRTQQYYMKSKNKIVWSTAWEMTICVCDRKSNTHTHTCHRHQTEKARVDF